MNSLLQLENRSRSRGSDVKRHEFFVAGVSIKSWAEARGFNPDLVYQVLTGQRKCLRGQSHAIAKELGMK